MTDDKKRIQQEHEEAHKSLLIALTEADTVIDHAQVVLSEAREKLKIATTLYQERLYGPKRH